MRVCRRTRECPGHGPMRHVVRPWPIKVKVGVHSSLHYRGFARQPYCPAETVDSFSRGKSFLSNSKHFHCSCHATWLSCKTCIVGIAPKQVFRCRVVIIPGNVR